MYQSSLQKGGDFANRVIGDIAKGSYGQVGSITGDDAAKAYASYMGLRSSDTEGTSTSEPLPQYSNMEIGGGRITGTETTDGTSRDFAMYLSDQYMAPTNGDYETVQSVDGATWYKRNLIRMTTEPLPTRNPLSRKFRLLLRVRIASKYGGTTEWIG